MHRAPNALPWRAQVALVLGVLILLPIGWMMIGLIERAGHKARGAVLRQLVGLSENYSLAINGRPIENPQRIVADLKHIGADRFNHSIRKNAEWYRIEISDTDQELHLLITEDVNRSDKYWVFLAGSGPLGTRIGSFTDADLATFLAAHQVRGSSSPR